MLCGPRRTSIRSMLSTVRFAKSKTAGGVARIVQRNAVEQDFRLRRVAAAQKDARQSAGPALADDVDAQLPAEDFRHGVLAAARLI